MATDPNTITDPSTAVPVDVGADGNADVVTVNGSGTNGSAAEIDPDLQPFELTLRFPERPLVPATATDAGLPATADPFKMPVNPGDTLSEVRMLIGEGPDGYWLGSFCFCLPSKQQANGSGKPSQAVLGKRLDEYVELKEIFKDVPKGEEEVVIVHTSFNESDARQHVQRVHNLLTSGLYDPSTIAIDSGISVRDAVQHPELWLEESSIPVEDSLAAEAKATPFQDFVPPTTSELIGFLPPQARPPRFFPTCLRHLSISAWSPPPHYLRRQGHLLYLQAVTLENETFLITSSTTGFYVNKSTANRFDPSPRPKGQDYASSSLIDLFCALSPQFVTNFGKIFKEAITDRDYHAIVPIQNQIPAAPWLARVMPHVADPARSQMAHIITGGVSTETLESTRDWHEEVSSAHEMSKATLGDRIWRDRLLSRTQAELTMAAARAVPKVAAGEAIALNPNDKPEAQMFLINNLFITKGVDSLGMFPHLGSDEAAHVIVGKDAQNVRILNALDVDGLTTLGTVIVDWMGDRWIVQTVVPGLFRQRDHGEVEEVPAVPPGDATSVESAAEASKPSESIKEDPRDSFAYRYGSVESPVEIRTDKQFHALFAPIGQALRLAEHEVPDGNDEKHSLWLSVECKGLHGSDGRKYIHDIARLMPVDVEWLEKDIDGQFLEGEDTKCSDGTSSYPHKVVLLRPELLELYYESQIRAWASNKVAEVRAKSASGAYEGNASDGQIVKEDDSAARIAAADKEAEEQKAIEAIDVTEFKLTYNPDAFVAFRMTSVQEDVDTDVPVKVLISDESDPSVAAVRSASVWLREKAISQFVQEVIGGSFTILDGAALTRHMHNRGINMRYLGRIAHASTEEWVAANIDAEVVRKVGGHAGFIKVLRTIALQEMVVRAAKRVLRSLLKSTPAQYASAAISHFLNCLLGTAMDPSPSPDYKPSPFQQGETPPAWTQLTPASLSDQVSFEVKRRFRFILPKEYLSTAKRERQILRELCYRCGLQLKLQEYHFEAQPQNESRAEASEDSHGEGSSNTPAPITKTAKKKKKAAARLLDAEPKVRKTTFVAEDIINLVPVLKEAGTKSSVAEQTFETGRQSVTKGEHELGAEFLMQGVQFHEQVYGAVHEEVARAFAQYAMIAQHFATLVVLQQNAILRRAQAEGEDLSKITLPQPHPDLTMETALRFQQHAVTIAERTLGLDHHETIGFWVSLANLQRSIGSFEAALQSQARILQLCFLAYGPDNHPETIQTLNNAGQALRDAGRIADSVVLYRAAHESALRLFGADSIHTASLAHELTQALMFANDFAGALAVEKTANAVFEKRLGPKDPTTIESQRYLHGLAASAVHAAKQEKVNAKKGIVGAHGTGGAGFNAAAINGSSRLSVQKIRAAQAAKLGQAAPAPLRTGPGAAAAAAAEKRAAAGKADALASDVSATMNGSVGRARPVDPNLSIDDLVDYIQGPPIKTSGKKKKAGGGSGRLRG